MSSHRHPSSPAADQRPGPVHRISGPAELLSAVPYLLGFHPRSSLVLVGMDAGILVVTARLDLADAEHDGVLVSTVRSLAAGGTSSLVAAAYDEQYGDERVQELLDRLAAIAEDESCPITEALIVRAGRWRSAICTDESCCPAAGLPVPQEVTPFVAAATVAGVVALPDRADLAASLVPGPGAGSDAMAALLAAAEHTEFEVTVAEGRARHERCAVRAIMRAARAADQPRWAGPDDAGVARFGVALGSLAVRDPVWMGVDDRRVDGRGLWRDLARRLPAPYDAAPLFLFGWASWRAGEGALAGIAAHRALDSDPGYSAADLLLAALARGVDPRRFPRLRMPRSA